MPATPALSALLIWTAGRVWSDLSWTLERTNINCPRRLLSSRASLRATAEVLPARCFVLLVRSPARTLPTTGILAMEPSSPINYWAFHTVGRPLGIMRSRYRLIAMTIPQASARNRSFTCWPTRCIMCHSPARTRWRPFSPGTPRRPISRMPLMLPTLAARSW